MDPSLEELTSPKKAAEKAAQKQAKEAEKPAQRIQLLEAEKAQLKMEILNLKGNITQMEQEAARVQKEMSREIASTRADKDKKVSVSGEANEAKTDIWRVRAERAEEAQRRAEEAQNKTQREWDRALKIELDIVHHAAQKRQALACGEAAAAARKAALAEGDMLWAAALQGLQGKYDDLEAKMKEANQPPLGHVAPVAAEKPTSAAAAMAAGETPQPSTSCCMGVIAVALSIDAILAPMLGVGGTAEEDAPRGKMVDGLPPADGAPSDWELNDAAAAAARGDVPTISCKELDKNDPDCDDDDK